MNVYFACSITGGRKYEPIYQAIVYALLEDGHEVPTAHLAGAGMKALEAIASPSQVYERDTSWIRACDTFVAEVSTPSHGVGYEVAFALSLGKKVLCLYQAGQAVSKMITGNTHPNIRICPYRDTQEAISILRQFLSLPMVDL